MLKDHALKREPNKAYLEFRNKFMAKYAASINGLSVYHKGIEQHICFAILCENARAYARGENSEIWPGAGKVNMAELCADVKMLDKLAAYKW